MENEKKPVNSGASLTRSKREKSGSHSSTNAPRAGEGTGSSKRKRMRLKDSADYLRAMGVAVDSAFDSTVGSVVGHRPVVHHSHRFFLKFLKSFGGDLQIQNWGDEKLAWITLPLRKKSSMLQKKRRIVFIPGLGDSPVSWMPIFIPLRTLLKKEYDELVFLDFPGFGGFLSREKSFDSMDRLLACSMDLLARLKPEAVVGHSLGGWIAGHYAATVGIDNHLKKLLLLSPSGVLGDEKSRKDWIERFERVSREGFRPIRAHVFHKEPFWFKFMLRDVAKFLDTPEMVSFLRSIEERHLLTDRLSNIRAKTFLLWGEKDSLIPSEWMKHWLAGLDHSAKARAVYVKGAGHSPHAERPTIVALLLGEIFLGKDLLGKVPSPFWKFVTAASQT
jgi:pimeloyl-ACP methyl ester carboxylesterase